jgi:hypothetical protein
MWWTLIITCKLSRSAQGYGRSSEPVNWERERRSPLSAAGGDVKTSWNQRESRLR